MTVGTSHGDQRHAKGIRNSGMDVFDGRCVLGRIDNDARRCIPYATGPYQQFEYV